LWIALGCDSRGALEFPNFSWIAAVSCVRKCISAKMAYPFKALREKYISHTMEKSIDMKTKPKKKAEKKYPFT